MSNYIFFDDARHTALKPLTFFRPASEIRFGILTIREKWKLFLQTDFSHLTEPYLQEKFPLKISNDNFLINGSVCPNAELLKEIASLQPDSMLCTDDDVIAIRLTYKNVELFQEGNAPDLPSVKVNSTYTQLNRPWDIVANNISEMHTDYELITKNRVSESISPTNHVVGNTIFLEKGANVEHAIIDTLKGPVYIGKDAEIMPGCILEGPVALGEHALAKMGSHLYAGTNAGPWCKIAGEISNTTFFAYSSKAHDGYMGDSVIAEWCNIGAGSITSNLKNNYGIIKQWSYAKDGFETTGLQFCGLIMGDHCKAGIHTMFNSGTTTGVCCNIFGAGYQPNFIPSFTWGGASNHKPHKLEEVLETAKIVYARRKLTFNDVDERIFKTIHQLTTENKRI